MKKSVSQSFLSAIPFALLLLLLASFVPSAWAATTVYTTRPTFNSAATGPLTIESLEDDTLGTKVSPTTLNGSNITVSNITNTLDIQVRNTDPSTYSTVNTTTGGAAFLAFGYGSASTSVYTVQFARTTAMTAFGFDLSGYQGDINVPAGSFGVTLLNGGTTVDTLTVADTTALTAHFRGFVSTTPFNAIRFTFNPLVSAAGSSDILAFDEIAYNAVPEPTSLATAALGLTLMGRRRRANAPGI